MRKTKYTVKFTTQFEKDYKLILKRGLKITLLDEIIAKLALGEPLDKSNHDHPLSGNWVRHRECHILPDWLLIYRIEEDVLVLSLSRTGSHSDLFGEMSLTSAWKPFHTIVISIMQKFFRSPGAAKIRCIFCCGASPASGHVSAGPAGSLACRKIQ